MASTFGCQTRGGQSPCDDAVNLAYDVLEPNIFMEDGKLMGLKIYPSQQA